MKSIKKNKPIILIGKTRDRYFKKDKILKKRVRSQELAFDIDNPLVFGIELNKFSNQIDEAISEGKIQLTIQDSSGNHEEVLIKRNGRNVYFENGGDLSMFAHHCYFAGARSIWKLIVNAYMNEKVKTKDDLMDAVVEDRHNSEKAYFKGLSIQGKIRFIINRDFKLNILPENFPNHRRKKEFRDYIRKNWRVFLDGRVRTKEQVEYALKEVFRSRRTESKKRVY